MIVAARTPSRDRLAVFSNKKLSYLRALEYELIPTIPLRGRILDFGGGNKTGYRALLNTKAAIDSLNIDARVEPSLLHDANTPFPIADASYDTIVSFNTLEHVRRDEFALGELVRILKPGGTLHIVVPFIYRVHGSPSDYHRHTAFWWEDMLADMGISRENSRIEPMMWGRMTSAFSFLEYTRLRFLRRVPLWLDIVVKGTGDEDYTLGYYIRANKP
ncbi:MAG: methyltransferase domain-containing protein [Hyphomicrobiaceae bacterium]|nr:methyltransferase domain-containing protein [Hyphomicrobiaceae bacterium]